MLTGELLPAQDPKYAHFLREALAADKGCKISDRCVRCAVAADVGDRVQIYLQGCSRLRVEGDVL